MPRSAAKERALRRRVVALYRAGHSGRAISAEVGVGYMVVRRLLTDSGVPMRRRGRRRVGSTPPSAGAGFVPWERILLEATLSAGYIGVAIEVEKTVGLNPERSELNSAHRAARRLVTKGAVTSTEIQIRRDRGARQLKILFAPGVDVDEAMLRKKLESPPGRGDGGPVAANAAAGRVLELAVTICGFAKQLRATNLTDLTADQRRLLLACLDDTQRDLAKVRETASPPHA